MGRPHKSPDLCTADDVLHVEGSCDFKASNGQTYEARGAQISETKAFVYVGTIDPFTKKVAVKDWHGRKLGEGQITSRWKQYHMAGPYQMAHVKFTIDGRHYSGRYSPDYGDLVKARRCKHAKTTHKPRPA